MGWGIDLWNQWKKVEAHCKDGVEFVVSVSEFMKKRAVIENEYAKSLQKLIANYRADLRKRKADQSQLSSVLHGWSIILNETEDMAKQHEIIGETLSSEISVQLRNFVKDLERDRKTFTADAEKFRQELAKSYRQVDQSQKNYHKLCKDAEVLKQMVEKLEKDGAAAAGAKGELEKTREQFAAKQSRVQEAENEYRLQLQDCNVKQTAHLEVEMANILDSFQKLEEDRAQRLKENFVLYYTAERKSFPIFQTCIDSMEKVTVAINGKQDTIKFQNENKASEPIPSPTEFVPYLSSSSSPSPTSPNPSKRVVIKSRAAKDGGSPPGFASDGVDAIGADAKPPMTDLPRRSGDDTMNATALYDFAAASDKELSFSRGDTLQLLRQDTVGWWYARLVNGSEGLVPQNYVEIIQQ